MSTRETRSTSKTNQRRAAISEVMAHEETPAWAQHLLTEFTNFRTSFDTKMTEVTNSVKDLKKETRTMNNRISEIETRTGSLEDELNASNERVKSLTKDVGDLQRKVDNMTAEYRKKNLIFMGLPEGLEKTPGELDNILRYVLDLKEGEATPEIEAQRRALKPKPKPDKPPRPYIVRILRWDDRQRILQAASKKQSLSWQDEPFRIQQDLTADQNKKRAQYDNIKKALRKDKSVRYGILYPTNFIVTIGNETMVYKNAKEAAEELKKKLPELFENPED